jgi:hypothetical protein
LNAPRAAPKLGSLLQRRRRVDLPLDLRLSAETAERFAAIALGHVEREYPGKLDHVLEGPGDAKGPRALHPIFHGSFDWHSCVHGYWLLVRLLTLFPHAGLAGPVRELLQRRLTLDAAAGELAYVQRPSSSVFERPYGWAWLLMLQAELVRSDDSAARVGAQALKPLAEELASRLVGYLGKLTHPVRAGTHANSAFALSLAADYAEACADAALREALRTRARDWFAADADCQAWEPSGEDFLSPALMEAECMRRMLSGEAFADWFARFLPQLERGQPKSLLTPAEVSDRADGKIAHLDGLNLSRAWCLRRLARAVRDERRQVLLDAADRHLRASLPAVEGDYMGEHWLASFALLALEA